MNQRLSPVEIICGIDNMQGGGSSDIEIIRNIARLAENSAKKVIKREGHAPDLVTYCYVPRKGLSPTEIRKERRELEKAAWHDLARLLIDLDPGGHELEAAAFTIIEVGQLSYFLETGQTQKAIISMANLLACGLLHSDQDKDRAIQDRDGAIQNTAAAITVLRDKHKNQSKNGGRGKLGYKSPIKQYIETACESRGLCNRSIDIAAQRIFNLFKDDNGARLYKDVYQNEEDCPIVAHEYDHDKQTLSYHAIGKNPEDEESINFRRLKDIIRELRKPITKKPE